MNSKKTLSSHWENVSKAWRHFPNAMDKQHKDRHLNRINKHLLE